MDEVAAHDWLTEDGFPFLVRAVAGSDIDEHDRLAAQEKENENEQAKEKAEEKQ